LLQIRNLQMAMPTLFYVSGDPAPFTTIAQQWLGYTPIVQAISLAELTQTSIPVESPAAL
jgi:glutamate racemase